MFFVVSVLEARLPLSFSGQGQSVRYIVMHETQMK